MEGRDGPPRLIRSFNELRDRVIAITIRRVKGAKARETSGGTSITIDEAQATTAGAGESQRALITAVHGDYYDCTIDGEPVQVAKPWRLRRNPFNGNSVSFVDEQARAYSVGYTYDGASDDDPSVRRTVQITSSGTDTFSETQVVIPRIKTSFDYIDVMTSENGTGVSGIDMIDLNTDGRAWARER